MGPVERKEMLCLYTCPYNNSKIYFIHLVAQQDESKKINFEMEVKRELERFLLLVPMSQIEDLQIVSSKLLEAKKFTDVIIVTDAKESKQEAAQVGLQAAQ